MDAVIKSDKNSEMYNFSGQPKSHRAKLRDDSSPSRPLETKISAHIIDKIESNNVKINKVLASQRAMRQHVRNFSLPSIANMVNGGDSANASGNSSSTAANPEAALKTKLRKSDFAQKSSIKPITPRRQIDELEYARKQLNDIRGYFSQTNSNAGLSSGSSPIGGKFVHEKASTDFTGLEKKILARAMFEKDRIISNKSKGSNRRDASYVADALSKPGTPRTKRADSTIENPMFSARDFGLTQDIQIPGLNTETVSQAPVKRQATKSMERTPSSFSLLRKAQTHRERLDVDSSAIESVLPSNTARKGVDVPEFRDEQDYINLNLSLYNASKFGEQYSQNYNMGRYDKVDANQYAIDKKTLNFQRTFNVGSYEDPIIPKITTISPEKVKRATTFIKETDAAKSEDDLYASLKRECPMAFSTIPAGRHDVLALSSWVENKISEIGRSGMREGEKCQKYDDVYNITLNEMLRQITMECAERGELLYRIWMAYYKLLVQFKTNLNTDREVIKAEFNKNIEANNEIFNLSLSKKNEEIEQLKKDLKASLQKNDDIQNRYDKFFDREVKYRTKIDQLKIVLEHMKNQIQILKQENTVFSRRLTSKKTYGTIGDSKSRNDQTDFSYQKFDSKPITRQTSCVISEIKPAAEGDRGPLSIMSSPRLLLNTDTVNQEYNKFEDVPIEYSNEESQKDVVVEQDDPNPEEKQDDEDSSKEEDSTVSEVDFVFVDESNRKQRYDFDQLNNNLLLHRPNEDFTAINPKLFDVEKTDAVVQTSITLIEQKFDEIFEAQEILNELVQERIIKKDIDKFIDGNDDLLRMVNLVKESNIQSEVENYSPAQLKSILQAVNLPESMIDSLVNLKQEVLVARKSMLLLRQGSYPIVSPNIDISPLRHSQQEILNEESFGMNQEVQTNTELNKGNELHTIREATDPASNNTLDSPNYRQNPKVVSIKLLEERSENKEEEGLEAEETGKRNRKKTSLKKVQFSEKSPKNKDGEQTEYVDEPENAVLNADSEKPLDQENEQIEQENLNSENTNTDSATIKRGLPKRSLTLKMPKVANEATPIAADMVANKKYVASQGSLSVTSGGESPTKQRLSVVNIYEEEQDDAIDEKENTGNERIGNVELPKRRESRLENAMGESSSSKVKLVLLAKMYKVEREKTLGLKADLENVKGLLNAEKQSAEALTAQISKQNATIKKLERLKDTCIHDVCPICGERNNVGDDAEDLEEQQEGTLRSFNENEEDERVEGINMEDEEDVDDEEDEEEVKVVNTETGETVVVRKARKEGSTKRKTTKQTTIATLPDFNNKKNKKEQKINPAMTIINTIKQHGMRKFKNYMPIKSVLKNIHMLYGARSPDSKEFALHKDEEFPNFVYNWFLNNFGFKKIAEQKFIVFVMSLKKYLYIVRINLFARFMNLLDGSSNYSLEEFNKYLEASDYVSKVNLGASIQHNETDSKVYIAYLKCTDYLRFFAESKMPLEEYFEFRKSIEVMKETDQRKNGIIDFDLMMTKVLAKYRIICNRTKQNVVTAFKAADLDGNKSCSLREFVTLYRNIEQDKYDYWFAEAVFNEHADLRIEGEIALSFDKFTVVCVEYTLFSDAQQDRFLETYTKEDLTNRMIEVKEKWAGQSEDIQQSFAIMTKISQDDIQYWSKIVEIVGKRILELDDPSSQDVKPLLITHKIMTVEIEKLKEADMDFDIYGVKKDMDRYKSFDTDATKSPRGTAGAGAGDNDFTEKLQKSPFFLDKNKLDQKSKNPSRNTSRNISRSNSRAESRQSENRGMSPNNKQNQEFKNIVLVPDDVLEKDPDNQAASTPIKKKSRLAPL